MRALGECCNFVHIQGRGVGGQDGAGLHDFVQFFEHSFFHAHFFKHGFNDHVCAADVVVAQGGAEQGHALIVFVLFQLALFDLRLVIFANRGHAAVQRFLLHLEHLDRNACVQQVH